jgi:hypothetical protein
MHLSKEFSILKLLRYLLTLRRLASNEWFPIFNLENPSGGEMSSRQLLILMDGVMINFRQHQRS